MKAGKFVVKPIETVYDGYRFRSRLEARWAVFFKNVGITYQYELEGFDLGEGVKYLPDFYLPHYDLHVEVKPNRDLSVADIRKMLLFAAEGDHDLLLIIGVPGSHQMRLLGRRAAPPWYELADSGDDSHIVTVFFECVDEWSEVDFAHLPRNGIDLVYTTKPPADNIDAAISTARQARFEHGAKPR